MAIYSIHQDMQFHFPPGELQLKRSTQVRHAGYLGVIRRTSLQHIPINYQKNLTDREEPYLIDQVAENQFQRSLDGRDTPPQTVPYPR